MNEDIAWIKYKKEFADVYEESNYGSPLRSMIMRAGHKMLEKYFDNDFHFGRVIEVGAGTGEHALYVKHDFIDYTQTDLNDNALNIAQKKINFALSKKFIFEKQSGSNLKYGNGTFDRLIAAHVLEHIHHPDLAIKEWMRVVKNDGIISVLIPTDPGILWRLGRHLGPRKDALKRGIPYDYIMAREHVNSCNNLIALLRFYFSDYKEGWWPTKIPSIDLNLFYVFHGSVNKKGIEK